MGTRSVRLDDEAERALEAIVKQTGLSISDAIKQGLIKYREIALAKAKPRPADFFTNYDLGPGGYAPGPARDSGRLVKDKLRKRALRDPD